MVVKRYEGTNKVKPLFTGLLLFILPLPLLVAVFIGLARGNILEAVASATAFGLYYFAAALLRKDASLAREAEQRSIMRRRSSLPYKYLASVLVGGATFVAAFMASDKGVVGSILFAVVASLGCVMTYGRDKQTALPEGMPKVGVTAEEVIDVIDEAEAKLKVIDEARLRIDNTELRDRLQKISAGVREILDLIAADPRDLRKARKFLKVYLDGAERVTSGYAQAHQLAGNPVLEDNFRRVLSSIEETLIEQKQKLAENNLSELDVQIEVLQMQLEKEGV